MVGGVEKGLGGGGCGRRGGKEVGLGGGCGRRGGKKGWGWMRMWEARWKGGGRGKGVV